MNHFEPIILYLRIIYRIFANQNEPHVTKYSYISFKIDYEADV